MTVNAEKKRKKNLGIPYPSKDPRYHRVWDLTNRQGKTLQEALKIAESGEKLPRKDQAKPRTGKGAKNGIVNAAEILAHPDVPDKVKDKIRAQEPQVHHTSPTGTPQNLTIPLTGTLDLTSILASLGKGQLAPEPDRLETIEKLLNDIARATANIALQLTRIADNQTGISISSELPIFPPPDDEGHQSPPPERKTGNGIKIGDRVKWDKRDLEGTVTRIMPGRNDVEVQFMGYRKTLLASSVSKVEAAG